MQNNTPVSTTLEITDKTSPPLFNVACMKLTVHGITTQHFYEGEGRGRRIGKLNKGQRDKIEVRGS